MTALKTQAPVPAARIGGGPTRSVAAASWTALGALLLRDVVVVRKHVWEFALRTIIQPFLLCFVFLYVFPKIGQGIGGRNPTEQSAFATILVPGVVGISVMFQGVQSIALAMAQEFGYTREIEDRVQAPCPIWLVAMAKVLSGAAQGLLSAAIVLPIASVVHAPGVQAHLSAALVDHRDVRAAGVHRDGRARPGPGDQLRAAEHRPDVRLHHLADHVPGRHLLLVDQARAGHRGRLALAADAGADQPADLRERGHAGRVHQRAAHAPLRHLPGGGRIRRVFLAIGLHNFRRRVLS